MTHEESNRLRTVESSVVGLNTNVQWCIRLTAANVALNAVNIVGPGIPLAIAAACFAAVGAAIEFLWHVR